jgi:hypothetical protein
VAPAFADPLTARIAEFLVEIGVPVEPAELTDDCFLPGLSAEGGHLLVDESRLAYPGDLLHEAGHIANMPSWAREAQQGNVDVPGLDTGSLEWAAIPWSYAAALAIGIDPAVVFHEGGYAGRADGLLTTFRLGGMFGVHLLESAGLTATPRRAEELGVEPFPHMLRWLRE